MNRSERFYKIDQMLHERRVVATETFLEELAISRATFKRDMEYMRERFNAPIVWDRGAGGYRFENGQTDGPAYELPGLWFSASELYALLACQRLLADIEPGFLARQVGPLQTRITAILGASGHPSGEIARRVRLLSLARRPFNSACFAEVARALLERRQVEIDAWSRPRDETNRRLVSPQRLVHYRDNWYLDAWCHWREGLRSFSLDTIHRALIRRQAAMELADTELDAHFAAAYGIFAGSAKNTAVLRFSAERARWVASERWHSGQQGQLLEDGGYRLSVPYSDERELLMDILRHGAHVTVEAPDVLRARVREEALKIATANSP